MMLDIFWEIVSPEGSLWMRKSPKTPFVVVIVCNKGKTWVYEIVNKKEKLKLNLGEGPTIDVISCLTALRMNWLLTLHCLCQMINKLIKGCGAHFW